jgi:predicted phage tail protein
VHALAAAEAKPGNDVEITVPLASAIGGEGGVAGGGGGFAYFAVEVTNDRGRSAGISNVVEVPTVAALPEPQRLDAEVTADAVVLTVVPPVGAEFTRECGAGAACYAYEIYRADLDDAKTKRAVHLATVATGAPLRDTSFEWQHHYTYTVHAVTTATDAAGNKVTFESGPAVEASVYTNDVFAPAAPTGLAAVFTAAAGAESASIDLSWDASAARDVAGYNVYRAPAAGGPAMKINEGLVKTPAYRDTKIAAGESYRYEVTAVDLRGNESARSAAATETVPRQ